MCRGGLLDTQTRQPESTDDPQPTAIGYHDCCNGHHLGRIFKSGRFAKLELFRHAVCPGDPILNDVIAEVTSARRIRCDICGDQQDWYPSMETLARLIDRALAKG